MVRDEGARIRFVERKTRHEFSEHMNLCLGEAKGEMVMILSDDDLIASSYVSSMVAMMRCENDVSVAVGYQQAIDEHVLSLPGESTERCAKKVFDGVEYVKGFLSGDIKSPVYTYFSLFGRRRDILDVGGFRPYPDGSNADNFIFLSLALRGKVAVAPAVMYYRIYATSFGLNTPFDRLLRACTDYGHDVNGLVDASTSMNDSDKAAIKRLVRRSSFGTLHGRLRTLYWKRLGIAQFIYYALKVLLFNVKR
jgi:hypothetical protein